ncbi:MAG: hypothetical protein IPJ65_18035 [Archangiaceae bacterium]|nr:hypothetical protein [Archangiaceae bacterium]
MTGKFEQALAKSTLPRRLGDVQLHYEPRMWVGRADRPPRAAIANLALVAGLAFGIAALGSLLTWAAPATVAALLLPCVVAFSVAVFFEQRDRRQRAFAVDFAEHLLRLDFSTRIGSMPRTVYVEFDKVSRLELDAQGGAAKVLTVDFEVGGAVFREVLIAEVAVGELLAAERVRRMLRAAVGLERPAHAEEDPEQPAGEKPVVDSFG